MIELVTTFRLAGVTYGLYKNNVTDTFYYGSASGNGTGLHKTLYENDNGKERWFILVRVQGKLKALRIPDNVIYSVGSL